jgi:hypothetical protein
VALVGGIFAFVSNGLHPHPSEFNLQSLLQEIAGSSTWGALHALLIFALVLILASLVPLAFSFEAEPGAALARFGCIAALLGGVLILVSTSMDGFAMSQVARAWVDAPAAEKGAALRIAETLEYAQYSIYSVSIAIFLGIGIGLYGLATVFSQTYPRWTGWIATLSGAGAFVVGVVQALYGPDFRGTEIWFVVFSIMSTVWVLIMGVLMWRKANIKA